MRDRPAADVYTLDELARAAGVPRRAVQVLLTSGDLRPIADTRFFSAADVIRATPALRATAVITQTPAPPRLVFSGGSVSEPPPRADRRLPLIVSSGAHVLLLVVAFWLTAGTSPGATTNVEQEQPRLVFLITPGAGGGGGGSGARQPRPPRRVERRGPARAAVSVPRVTPDPAPLSERDGEQLKAATPAPEPPPPPEPLAARTVVAPVVITAANTAERSGVVERPAATGDRGPGAGVDAGAGRGAGNGAGTGAGIGEGSGGGTGGGPYRPGSGISPPRLLNEVKADYTEDARRRGISGAVLLEIVVTRDGSVGEISVRRGLGAGLDERAIAAVRQWRFAPATRLGAAVDVLVEVSVEFTLR